MSKRRILVAVPEHIKSLDDVRIPDGATYVAQTSYVDKAQIKERETWGFWYAYKDYGAAKNRDVSNAIYLFQGPIVNENWRKTYKVKTFIDAVQDEIVRRNGTTIKTHIPFPPLLHELWSIGEVLNSQSKVLFIAQMKDGWWHGYERISHAHYRTQPITPLFKSEVVDNNDKRAFSRAGFLRLMVDFVANLEVEVVGNHDYSTKHYIPFPPTGECSISAGTRALRQDERGRWYCYTSIEAAVKEAPDRELAIEAEVAASCYGKVYTLNAFLQAVRESDETKVIEEAVASDNMRGNSLINTDMATAEIRVLAHAILNNSPTKETREDFWDSMRHMKRDANSNAVQESEMVELSTEQNNRTEKLANKVNSVGVYEVEQVHNGKGEKRNVMVRCIPTPRGISDEVLQQYLQFRGVQQGETEVYRFDDWIHDAQPDFVFGGDPCTIAFSTPSKPEPAAPVWPPDTVASTNGLVDIDLTLRLAAALQQD